MWLVILTSLFKMKDFKVTDIPFHFHCASCDKMSTDSVHGPSVIATVLVEIATNSF